MGICFGVGWQDYNFVCNSCLVLQMFPFCNFYFVKALTTRSSVVCNVCHDLTNPQTKFLFSEATLLL